MKKMKYFSWLLVLVNLAVFIWFCSGRTPGKQLGSMAVLGISFCFLFGALIFGFGARAQYRWSAFAPFLICFVGFPLFMYAGAVIGKYVKEARFNRNLPRYMEVVQLVEAGKINKVSPDSSKLLLPAQYADLAFMALASTNSNGTVEFITELGFPVKHSGYLYVSNGTVEDDPRLRERWPLHDRINTNWFYVSD